MTSVVERFGVSIALLLALTFLGCDPAPVGGYPVATADAGPTGPQEVCGNGLDDNGNGRVDEDCSCANVGAGGTQACYPGPAMTRNIGACKDGHQTCIKLDEFEKWGSCEGAVLPVAPELCDGIDNDCNGAVDDLPGCNCVPGTKQACYRGDEKTRHVGACKDGEQVCDARGSAWGTCENDVRPQTEVCADGIDNDCDGQTDEGCTCKPGATQACYTGPQETRGKGECKDGQQVCASDGSSWGACTGSVLPAPEVCGDKKDNNCNGQVDETCLCQPGQITACFTGPINTHNQGVCTDGQRMCLPDGSGFGQCIGEGRPSTEICGDTLDNDCDGMTDETCVFTLKVVGMNYSAQFTSCLFASLNSGATQFIGCNKDAGFNGSEHTFSASPGACNVVQLMVRVTTQTGQVFTYTSNTSPRFRFTLLSTTPEQRVYDVGFEDNYDNDYNDLRFRIEVPRPYFRVDGTSGGCN